MMGLGKKRFSLPAEVFQQVTQQKKLCKFFSQLQYIERAVSCIDPIERLKNVIVFFTTIYYYGFDTENALTPHLGETL